MVPAIFTPIGKTPKKKPVHSGEGTGKGVTGRNLNLSVDRCRPMTRGGRLLVDGAMRCGLLASGLSAAGTPAGHRLLRHE